MQSSNKIYCLIGPSGAGKDTIKNELKIPHIVSYRTRSKRANEVEGIDGYFITEELFKEMDKYNRWIASTCYAGNYYGITQDEIFPLNDTSLLYVVDWNGVVTLKEALNKINGYSDKDIVTIFIDSDREEVYKRMITQGRNTNEIAKRMQQYDEDILIREKCDYQVVNLNSKLSDTVKRIYEIILFEQGIITEV